MVLAIGCNIPPSVTASELAVADAITAVDERDWAVVNTLGAASSTMPVGSAGALERPSVTGACPFACSERVIVTKEVTAVKVLWVDEVVIVEV